MNYDSLLEIQQEQREEMAREAQEAMIDQACDEIWDEIANGEHWQEIACSPFVDSADLVRCAMSDAEMLTPNVLARGDLKLQIEDYVRAAAKDRVL